MAANSLVRTGTLAGAGLLALAGSVLPAQASPATPARWHVVATVTSGKASVRLDGVIAFSARNAWTVGAAQADASVAARPVAANWNGHSWRHKTLPAKAMANLGRKAESFGIAGTSGSNVWIYSAAGWARWNGRSWLSGRFPVAVRHESSQQGQVLAFSSRNVWLIGEGSVGTRQVPFARRYDGRRWHVLPAPRITGFLVSGASPSAICVVNGQFGAAVSATTAMECWNGHRWAGVALPVRLDRQHAIIGSIYVRSARDVWVGGGSPAASGTVGVAAHWRNGKWSVRTLPAVATLGTDVLNTLAPDGHGGLWADGECDCGGPAWRLWHYNGHTWAGPTLPAIGGVYGLIAGFAAVPHTTSTWAVGTRGTAKGSAGVVLAYGRTP
jgi:hypothetical protein